MRETNNIGFKKHPSESLQELYKRRNFQGANPELAKVLFVGKDPNWAVDIEFSPIFELVKDYLFDGVKFWQNQNIHHPFLHSKYIGDGKKYHQAIKNLKFNSELAENISFVEIIGFPTTGMSSTKPAQFNKYLLSSDNHNHLIELDKLLNNSEKRIFMFWGLIKHLKFINSKTGLFKNLSNIDQSNMIRTDLNRVGNIYVHKHFSMGISQETLDKISLEVKSFLS